MENIKTEFKQWIENKKLQYLEKTHSGKIFKDFIEDFTTQHYSDISLVISNVERSKRAEIENEKIKS